MIGDTEYFESKDFQEILNKYEESVKSGQSIFIDADDLTDIADYYHMEGRLDEAGDAINLALQLTPDAVAPLLYKAREAMENNDMETAESYAELVKLKDPVEYVYLKGELMLSKDRADEADAFYKERYDEIDSSEQTDYAFDVASIFADYYYYDKSMAWMSLIRGDDSDDFKELSARTLYGLGKYKDSERLFNELIDHNPYSKRYWNALANAQFMSEDYSASVDSSEYAIAIDPDDPESILSKAVGLYRLENFEEALEYFKRYNALVEDDEFGYLHQATCLVGLNRNDEAISSLEHAEELAGEDSPYLPDIYQELAFVYSEKKMLEKALHYIDLTKTLDCDHAEIEVIRGHVLLANGHVEEAEETFRDAVLKAEDKEKIMLRMLVSLYDNGYVSAAYFMFQKYFEMVGPECYVGYAYIALCCWDLHKANEFIKYLETAVERNPREAKTVLCHLFPEDMQPADYVEYARNRINKTS